MAPIPARAVGWAAAPVEAAPEAALAAELTTRVALARTDDSAARTEERAAGSVALARAWLKLERRDATSAETELWTALAELLADAMREETPATAELRAELAAERAEETAEAWPPATDDRTDAGALRRDEACPRRDETAGIWLTMELRSWAPTPAASTVVAMMEKRMLKEWFMWVVEVVSGVVVG